MATVKPSIPKGTRDFTPTEMMRRNYIFDTIRTVFHRHACLPIETPAMENLSAQILSSQSVDEVTYPESNQYTSMVLHQAIRSALDKGRIAE